MKSSLSVEVRFASIAKAKGIWSMDKGVQFAEGRNTIWRQEI
jgi:hypothetical protein